MQRSEKQIIASRLNGAKSRGPITPEGKLRSCQNAIRHVALARSITLEMEDSSIFLTNLNDLCNAWQPADLTEHKLVESMAVAMWKKDRYEVSEKVATDQRIANDGHNAAPHTYPDAAVIAHVVIQMTDRERTLKSLSQTIALLDRQYSRALNMLMKVQEYRRRYGLGQNTGNDPTQLDQSPISPVMTPPEAIEPEPAPIEPVVAEIEPDTDETTEPATDAGPALTTLSAPKMEKRTHNVFPINTQTHAQPAEPETHDATDTPEIGANRLAIGGAAA